MITEDYVSFEIAKLLKEKGFDGPCYNVWESYDDSQTLVGAPWFVEGETVVNKESVDAAAKLYADEYNINNKVEGYLAPTLQMAMKWLREKQNLFIEIQCYGCEANKKAHFEYSYVISEFVKTDNKICTAVGLEEKKAKSRFSSYEEACEVAIKYCLENLI